MSFFAFLGLCGSWEGDNKENGWKNIFGPEYTMPDRAVLLVILCVYEQKTFRKSVDINKTLPKLISTAVATPPHRPRAATCNSLQEIDIFLFVKFPLI